MNVIVDYGLGNLKSVQKAFLTAGMETIVSNDPENIKQADLIILPGVGAFRDAIQFLEKNNLSDLIRDQWKKGKYIVGICLGMQLLYDKSYEYGEYDGLGIIEGDIIKLEKEKKIPHMGWNQLKIDKNDQIVKYVNDGDNVYFVHSYYAKSNQEEMVASASYGETIPAIVRKGNVIGFQFHPEKSSNVGANLLKALGELINENTTGN